MQLPGMYALYSVGHCVGLLSQQLIPWCSGYHVSLTHSRSPVRSRVESHVFFFFDFSFFFSLINLLLSLILVMLFLPMLIVMVRTASGSV